MTAIPGGFNPIQQESVTFNNPVSEAALNAMGASINGILSVILPVGSVIDSMLTEAQFQTAIGSTKWVLSDGRSVTGSEYQLITSNTNIPDLRAAFTRGKDNGRGLDPNGNQALGTFNADQFKSHDHSFSDPTHFHTTTYQGTGLTPQLRSSAYGSGSSVSGTDATGSNAIITNNSATGITFIANGGNQTNPMNVIVNKFIRIN